VKEVIDAQGAVGDVKVKVKEHFSESKMAV
jgi:hypothetical protein